MTTPSSRPAARARAARRPRRTRRAGRRVRRRQPLSGARTPPADLVEKARDLLGRMFGALPAARGARNGRLHAVQDRGRQGLGAARGRVRFRGAAQRRAQDRDDAGAAVAGRRHGRARARPGRGHDARLQDGDERLARRGRALRARAALPRRRACAGRWPRSACSRRGVRHLPHGAETVVIGRLGGDDNQAGGTTSPAYREADLLVRQGPRVRQPGRRAARRLARRPQGVRGVPGVPVGAAGRDAGHPGRCVRIYVEADFDIFQNKGSAANVTNYITAVFNQSAMLYANEASPSRCRRCSSGRPTSPYTAELVAGCCRSSSLPELASTATSGTSSLPRRRRHRGRLQRLLQRQHRQPPVLQRHPDRPSRTCRPTPGRSRCSRTRWAPVARATRTPASGTATTPRSTAAPRPRAPARGPAIPSGGGTIMSYCHLAGVGIRSRRLRPAAGQHHPLPLRERLVPDRLRRQPAPAAGCTTYTGSLSGTGAVAVPAERDLLPERPRRYPTRAR